jgi:hypothetical protein
VVVEDALAGVEAGRRGGFGLVVGVDGAGHGQELLAHGADVVVPDLTGIDLTGTDLAGTDLAGTDLSGTDLAGTDLSDVDVAPLPAREGPGS